MIRILLLLTAAVAGMGQEPGATAARTAAEQWMPLVDALKFDESWEKASSGLRKTVPKEQWVQSLAQSMKPLGKFKARSLETTKFLKDPPEAPAGDYYLLQYRADFENRNGAIETVVMALEGGKTWRTAGYFIR